MTCVGVSDSGTTPDGQTVAEVGEGACLLKECRPPVTSGYPDRAPVIDPMLL